MTNNLFRQLPENSKNPERDFWRVYQTYIHDSKQLEESAVNLKQLKTNVEETNSELLILNTVVLKKVKNMLNKRFQV